jgi:small subunit ribosomal protein S17
MSKKLIGIVSSDVQDKTIVITVTRRETHPIYKKQYTVTSKYAAHDEKNEAHKGDKVEISETRPISKNKSFKLDRIIETGHGDIEIKEEVEV